MGYGIRLMNRKSLRAYHAKKNHKIVNNVKLTKQEDDIINATHGHSSGGLNLYSVHDKKKVHIANPIFLKHKNTVVAQGHHNGHMVSQIVKHKD